MAMQEIEFDRSLLGVEHQVETITVDKEKIVAFCQAIGETNPIYTDDAAAKAAGYRALLAPPTFSTLLVRGTGRPDIKLNFGRTSFRAGEAIEVLGPIHAGDVLDVRSSLKTVYTKTGRSGTMCFVVWETSFTNKEGERVIAIQESMVRR